MIFNIGDKVDYVKEDIQGIVKRRGTNYVVLEDNNNNLHKAWIWDCIPIAADREIEVREYNLDVDYGFKAVSEIIEDTDKTPQDKTVGKKPGTQPKKYYKDLSKGEKEKRADFFKKQKYKKSDDEDSSDYYKFQFKFMDDITTVESDTLDNIHSFIGHNTATILDKKLKS